MLENSLFILITMTGIYSAAALFCCLHILKWRGLQIGLLGELLLLAAGYRVNDAYPVFYLSVSGIYERVAQNYLYVENASEPGIY